jgi:hypothetical protein
MKKFSFQKLSRRRDFFKLIFKSYFYLLNLTSKAFAGSISINLLGSATGFTSTTAVFGGGTASTPTASIEKMTIATTGTATNFGALTLARTGVNATSNATQERGLFVGGFDTGFINGQTRMDYITINSPGNATNFGEFTVSRGILAAVSNGTSNRGVFQGGSGGMSIGLKYTIDYVTISSTSNATSFGSLAQGRYWPGGTSNSTNNRGLSVGGGVSGTPINPIEYITISTTGNSLSFGVLSAGRHIPFCVSNSTLDKGVFMGHDGQIEYVNISTLSNSYSFGTSGLNPSWGCGSSNGINNLAVMSMFGGTSMKYLNISTNGSCQSTASLVMSRDTDSCGATSDA